MTSFLPSAAPDNLRSLRSARAFSFNLLALLSLSTAAISLITPNTYAAPPSVTVTQPVQVQVVNTEASPAQVKVVGPVEMQGTVVTLDEVARTPYNKTVTAIDPSAKTIYLQFPFIPTGKRLVIKAIGLQCSVSTGYFAYAYLRQNSAAPSPDEYRMPVTFQSTIPSGVAVTYSAMISTEIAFDGGQGINPTIEVNIPASPGVTPFVWGSISGYLVDL
ncbi:MAG: hypothetical protein ABIZ04_21515 [Opitutus sp.]